nr:ribonuclease H-like domain-containing protein [Tanacetum cinerariifolium]
MKAKFGGNEESKKMRKTMLKQEFSEFSVSEEEGLHKGYDRLQKILSQLNQMQEKLDNDDVNIKFLKALPPSWSQVALTHKTRGILEYLSFNDLYNKLRSLEIDVKGGSSYGSRSTTVAPTHSAFIYAASTNTKMVYSNQPSTRIEGRTQPKRRLTIVYFVSTTFCAGMPAMLLVVLVFLLVVVVYADGWVSAGSCTIPTGSYSFMLLDWFLLCKIHVKYRSFHSRRAKSPYDNKWAKKAQGK